ncbi:wd g-beta repeat-containing protein [Cyclospora cayetanensis]|uniref:Wd g-beta repeat-containing protein n=1 Tax=Cyclospora cayetanensis TaxID=88456 RepID=A0A1D3CXN0_9EIME|nr:wd g-beta repeat-containing protein [Cyclospora cayetanensis]
MTKPAVSYLDYPIYSAASDGNFIITSGGGGGKDYGIEDQLELHRYSAETKKLVTFDSVASGGVIDSLNHNKHASLFCGCSDKECVLIKADTNLGLKVVHRFGAETASKRLIVARFSPTGEYVVAGGEDRIIRVWRVFNEDPQSTEAGGGEQQQPQQKIRTELMAELRGHQGDIKDVSMSEDSQLVASCGGDGRLCLWDWRGQELLLSHQVSHPRNSKQTLNVRCCRFLRGQHQAGSSQKRLIAVASDARGPSFLFGWRYALYAAIPLHPAASSQFLTISRGSLSASPMEAARLTQLGKAAAHELPATGLCFIENGMVLVSTSADYSVAHVLYTGQQLLLLRQQALASGNYEATLRDLLSDTLLQQHQNADSSADAEVSLHQPQPTTQQQPPPGPRGHAESPHDEL